MDRPAVSADANFIMYSLFPKSPVIPAVSQTSLPACEWVMPAPAATRREYASLCKKLPAGQPDYLLVDILHSQEGVERCTAAVYDGHVYVIHYGFSPRRP